jgi:hypothetical protein
VDTLRGTLPGEEFLGGAQDPGAPPVDTMRLWTQFTDRGKNTPLYLPQTYASQPVYGNVDEGGQQGLIGQSTPYGPGFYSTEASTRSGGMNPEAEAAMLGYGTTGYDYAGSGFPEPGQYFGSKSDAWQNLTIDQVLKALMGGGNGSIA